MQPTRRRHFYAHGLPLAIIIGLIWPLPIIAARAPDEQVTMQDYRIVIPDLVHVPNTVPRFQPPQPPGLAHAADVAAWSQIMAAIWIETDPINQGLLQIGRCEQAGSGPYGIAWQNPGPQYPGGLGVDKGTARAVGADRPMSQMSLLEQLDIGRRVQARWGFTAWSCMETVGLH